MMNEDLKKLSDEELLKMAKKRKTTAITNAFLIGFLAGVIVYSVAKNTWGFLTLIPLFMIYKLVNSKKPDTKMLDEILKERGLK